MKKFDFPPKIHIELCNFCNAACVNCPIPKMERKHKIMDFQLFEKIITELKKEDYHGEIYPFLHGESLLIPNVLDYLRQIKKKIPKSKTVLYTNGSMLNENISNSIIKESLVDTLEFSIDGGTNESFENIRKNLSFEKVKTNIKKFLNIKKFSNASNPKTIINMVITPENQGTIDNLKNEFKDIDEINLSIKYNYAGQLDEEKSNGLSDSKFHYLTTYNSCWKVEEYIFILSNGNVCLCCFDYEGKEILGNVKESSIKEIWHGKEFQKRRNYLKKRKFSKLPLCQNCDFVRRNIISRQLIKLLPSIERIFPNFSKYTIVTYSKIKKLF